MIQSAPSEPGGASVHRGSARTVGLVGEGRLIPMVAVGHEQRLPAEIADEPVVRLGCGQLMEEPVAVTRPPLVGPGPAHDVVVALGAVEVEADDRAELRVRGVEQREAVGLWAGHRVLVRADAAPPRLEQHARDDSLDRRRVRDRRRSRGGSSRRPAPPAARGFHPPSRTPAPRPRRHADRAPR